MHNIEISLLEENTYYSARRLMATAARVTQRVQFIGCMDDLIALHNRPVSDSLIASLAGLPHPTLQKFGTITIAIVGASRRFLAQITRHQNEVKYMSGSLQYSDMTGAASFVVPYSLLHDSSLVDDYLRECHRSQRAYETLIRSGADHDSAGYLMPQGMRNTLLISATPYQWKHMISQRTCRRNSDETRIIMLRVWSLLLQLDHSMFSDIGPFCMTGECREGKMACGSPLPCGATPDDILQTDYPLLFEQYTVKPMK